MPINDFIAEVKEAKAHEHTFTLWPKLWQEYANKHGYTFKWNGRLFLATAVNDIPDKPGLYTFVIQPRVANHPLCSYLMYVGKTNTLRRRYRNYLREKQRDSGRPKIVWLLNTYPDNVCFCYTVVQSTASLAKMERALLGAYVPPCNRDQLPARVRRIMGALR